MSTTDLLLLRPADPSLAYSEVLFSSLAERVLRQGNILPPDMSVGGLLSRILCRFALTEDHFDPGGTTAGDVLAEFHGLLRAGVVLLGSPLLTNIAHGGERPLASCSAVPCADDVRRTQELAEAYYLQNMGSGFDLSRFADPVAVLRDLNAHASVVEGSGACERYVGNMAHVDADHPRISEFISSKLVDRGLLHFNISVNITDAFMSAVATGGTWSLRDGTVVSAQDLWGNLVTAAHECGDPGVISLDRLNAHNALAAVNPYVTTAPCAEVGLAEGETCVFGYISLAPLVKLTGAGRPELDFNRLGRAARVLTQILDDAVEYSSEHQPNVVSRQQHRFARKIGIGLCGYADLLILLGIPYGSEAAVSLLRDCVATLSYESKVRSAELSERRGPFGGFPQSMYAVTTNWVDRFTRPPTRVSADAWSELADRVQRTGLRNSMTCALPPSGRVSLLLGVSSSIEPYLSLGRGDSVPISVKVVDSWLNEEGTHPRVAWPATPSVDYGMIVRDAFSVSIDNHLAVVGGAASLVDDGISKTLNLPASATVADVDYVLTRAWNSGLKAMSIYRRGSHPSLAGTAAKESSS